MKSAVLRGSLIAATLIPGVESLAAAACPSAAVRYASSSHRIYVSGGGVSCTLTDLDALVPSTVIARVDSTQKIWILRAELFLEKGAKLVLHGSAAGGDVNELRLRSNDSSSSGSVVIIRADWGAIDIASTRIRSWDESAGGPDTRPTSNGRAYIHVRSRLSSDGSPLESRMDIRDSDIGYLGYHNAESYGLTWKVSGSSSGLYDKVDVLGDVTNNHIHHNYFGAYTYGAYGMHWAGNEFDHNVEYGLDPHDDSDSLVVEDNDFHDNGNHGFICSQRCDHLTIRDNRSWNNDGCGMMIHRSVTDSILERNEVWDNADAGLAIMDSSGNTIRDNYFHDNLRGIRLSVGSSDNLIEGNTVENHEVGLYFYQGSDTPTTGDGRPRNNTFLDNQLAGNARAVDLKQSDDNEFIGNVISGTDSDGLVLEDGQGNVLARNVIPDDARIDTLTNDRSSASTTITQGGGAAAAISPLLVDPSGHGTIVFRETGSLIHMVQGSTLETRATSSSSTLTLSSSSARLVVPVWIYATPSSGTVLVSPRGARTWNARSSSGTLSVQFKVSKLPASTTCTVRRNGSDWKTLTSTSSGTITFSDSVGTSSASYSVVIGG